jgi:hypothetical protein
VRPPRAIQGYLAQRDWYFFCRTTSVSAAHATHCATYCTPCQPLLRDFPGWIRSRPPPPSPLTCGTVHTSYHPGPWIPPPTWPPQAGRPWLERTQYIAPCIVPPRTFRAPQGPSLQAERKALSACDTVSPQGKPYSHHPLCALLALSLMMP